MLEDEKKIINLERLMNGVTNYNYGVYNQIANVNLLILKLINSDCYLSKGGLELKILLDLKSYLEGIAKAGDIKPYT